VLAYAAGLTGTSQHTLAAKARLFVGSDVEAETVDPVRRTPLTDQAGTLVTRYLDATIGDTDVTVLAVDPDTLPASIYWEPSYAGRPLAALLGAIRAPAPGGRVAALLVRGDGLPGGVDGARFDVPLGTTTARVTVAATVRLFPGRRLPGPMLIVDARRLGAVDPHAGSHNELWSRRDQTTAEVALTTQRARVFAVLDRDRVFQAANFLGISWAFGYLSALAALVGLVAVGGLLLYLETRQRSRVAAYALGKRMGLTRATHLRSLLAELGTLLITAYLVGIGLAAAAVQLVYRRLDVDLHRPPAPILTVPVVAIVTAGLAVVVIVALASAYAQRAAERTNVAEVLRLGS
jgi:putative ABC transport system permease protein